MTHNSQNLKAIACAVLGFGLFSVNDVMVKYLAQSYSVTQTLFWTAFFVCPILTCFGYAKQGKKAFSSKLWKWHIIRGVLMTGLVFCNIYALVQLKVSDFYAVVFTNPLSISLLSWFLLKDKMTKAQLTTIILGLFVVLYMCRPGSGLFNIGTLSAFAGTIFFAFATVLVRSKLRKENPLIIGISGPVVITLVALPLAAYSGFAFPETSMDWFIFVLCGVTAGFGGALFGMGFQYASSAAVVAPFHYTQMIWGALMGYFIFDEIPTQNVIIGSTVLAILGIYLIYTEAKYKKKIAENLIQHEPV